MVQPEIVSPARPAWAIAGRANVRNTYPLLLVAMELDDTEDRAPLPKLIDPVVKGGLGHNDHVWP